MVPTIENLAKQIAIDLKGSRLSGKSSPEKPVKANVICYQYKLVHDWDIEDREIRGATKFLIGQKVPIGSTLSGYYYVLNSTEWEITLSMLIPKFLSIKQKIDAIKEMQQEMAMKEAHQEEIEFTATDLPIMKILNDKLGLEKVNG